MRKRDCSGHYDKVRLIMKHFGQAMADAPGMPDETTRLLRARLMFEEVLETIQKGLGVKVCSGYDGDVPIHFEECRFEIEGEGDLVELADGCADTKVVTTGTLISAGIPDLPLQDLIDDNNLTKMGGPVIDGKFQKPPGYKPPDVKGLLEMLSGVAADENLGKIRKSDTKVIDDSGIALDSIVLGDSGIELPLAEKRDWVVPGGPGYVRQSQGLDPVVILDERDFLTQQQEGKITTYKGPEDDFLAEVPPAACGDPNKPDCEACQ